MMTVPCYEITIAVKDQAKLLSKLTVALGDLGLDIREAHAFISKDGNALDVFVVDGWNLDALEALEDALADRVRKREGRGRKREREREREREGEQLYDYITHIS